jgi:hypothetical protein
MVGQPNEPRRRGKSGNSGGYFYNCSRIRPECGCSRKVHYVPPEEKKKAQKSKKPTPKKS